MRCWLGACGLLLALACSSDEGRRDREPLAPGGTGGGGGEAPTGVPPPIVHAPPEFLDVEVLGKEVGAPRNVRDVSVDAGGGVWIAAEEGLFVRRPGAAFFEPIGGLPSAEVDAVGGLNAGIAAVSFLGGEAPRLVRLDATGAATLQPLRLNPVVSRFRTVDTASGRMAILATGAGIAVLDGTGRVHGVRALPEPTLELWDVALTDAGDAWLGDAARLLRLEGPVTLTLSGEVLATLDLVPDDADDVVAIEVCPDGDLWVSSLGNGVFRLSPDGAVIEHLRAEDVLPQDHVPSLACDLDGTVWIGTSWGGIARRDPDGRFRYHTAAAGLPGDSIRRLLVVPDGAGGRTLWIATERGVAFLGGG